MVSSGTLFPRQVCGSPAACPPIRALTVEGGTAPPPTPRTWPPSLSPTWMYAIFARATHSGPGMAPPRPLCPRQRERGEKAKGERKKRRPVAPDVTGVADERRPPLRRPPRPCLSLRFGSGSRGHLQAGGAEVPRSPASASLAVPRSPRSRSPGWNEARAPEEGAGGSRGDCNDPGAGGAGDAGASAREGRGRGGGWRSGWERAVHGSAHPVGARTGTYREQSLRGGRETEGVRYSPPQSLELGRSSPIQPSLKPAWKNFIPAPSDAPRTVAVRNAEAK